MMTRGFSMFSFAAVSTSVNPRGGMSQSLMFGPGLLGNLGGFSPVGQGRTFGQPVGIDAFAPNIFAGIGSGPAAFPLAGLTGGPVPGGESVGGLGNMLGPVGPGGSIQDAEQATAAATALLPQPIGRLLNFQLGIAQWFDRNKQSDPLNGPEFNNAFNFLFGPQNDDGPGQLGIPFGGVDTTSYFNPLGSNIFNGFLNTNSQRELNNLTQFANGIPGVPISNNSSVAELANLQNVLNASGNNAINGFLNSGTPAANPGLIASLLAQGNGGGQSGGSPSELSNLRGLLNSSNGVNGFLNSGNPVADPGLIGSLLGQGNGVGLDQGSAGELGNLSNTLGQNSGNGVEGFLGSNQDPLMGIITMLVQAVQQMIR